MSEYVYLLRPIGRDEPVKVGMTTRDPRTRAQELTAATGTPFKLEVYAYWEVVDAAAAEKEAHRRLATWRTKGEWFAVGVGDAYDAVADVCEPRSISRGCKAEGWQDAISDLDLSVIDRLLTAGANPKVVGTDGVAAIGMLARQEASDDQAERVTAIADRLLDAYSEDQEELYHVLTDAAAQPNYHLTERVLSRGNWDDDLLSAIGRNCILRGSTALIHDPGCQQRQTWAHFVSALLCLASRSRADAPLEHGRSPVAVLLQDSPEPFEGENEADAPIAAIVEFWRQGGVDSSETRHRWWCHPRDIAARRKLPHTRALFARSPLEVTAMALAGFAGLAFVAGMVVFVANPLSSRAIAHGRTGLFKLVVGSALVIGWPWLLIAFSPRRRNIGTAARAGARFGTKVGHGNVGALVLLALIVGPPFWGIAKAYEGWEIVQEAFLVFNAPGSPVAAPTSTARPSETGAPSVAPPPSMPAVLCGSPAADVRLPDWEHYRCLTERDAGERWAHCLGRARYTAHAGHGCPGQMRCCPPDSAMGSEVVPQDEATRPSGPDVDEFLLPQYQDQ